MVDVGGGSTEVVLGEWDGIRADVQVACSVDVGCVRITERHLRADLPSEEDVGSAEAFATQALAGAFAEVPVDKARTWVGVAGTVTTLSAIAQEQNRQPSRLPCAEPKVDRRPVGYGRGTTDGTCRRSAPARPTEGASPQLRGATLADSELVALLLGTGGTAGVDAQVLAERHETQPIL